MPETCRDRPLVSICCVTYNHESFIRDAIEGFLIQKTSFSLEIIIHDDASTDSTAKIVKEYVKKYPNLITPIFQMENQYSKGIKPFYKFILPIARGKYIAICEGDDYWIDPYKLQKQVNYLEYYQDITMVFTNKFIKYKNNLIPISYDDRIYNTKDILSSLNWGSQTICFRKNCIDLSEAHKLSKTITGDRLIPYLCSLKGKIRRLKDFTTVYRNTGTGVSTSRPQDKIIEISLDDFWLFHKTLNFPDWKMLIKGQTRYISRYLTVKNLIHPLKIYFYLKKIITKYESLTIHKLLLFIYYFLELTMDRLYSKSTNHYIKYR